jgi:hypothetical protein
MGGFLGMISMMLSPLWFDDFIEKLGYDNTERLKIYWLIPVVAISDCRLVNLCLRVWLGWCARKT